MIPDQLISSYIRFLFHLLQLGANNMQDKINCKVKEKIISYSKTTDQTPIPFSFSGDSQRCHKIPTTSTRKILQYDTRILDYPSKIGTEENQHSQL